MAVNSSVTIDPANGKSTLTYITGAVTRSVEYSDGWVSFPAIVTPVVMSIDDFQALVTDISEWILIVQAMIKIPIPPKPSISGQTFSIGAQSGTTWPVSSAMTFYGSYDGTMEFHHTPGVGVTLSARPAIKITWANLVARNKLAYAMITAAQTGQRPRTGANVVGPQGQPGAKGDRGDVGPVGPSAPYRQRDIGLVWNNVNMNSVVDTPLTIPFALWRAVEVTGYSPSVNLSNTARFGIYTAPAGGGLAIVNAGLVGLNIMENDTYTIVAAIKKTTLNAGTVYLRNTQAFGSAAACSFQITIRDLSN